MNPLVQGLPVLLAGLLVWAVVAGRLWLPRLAWVSVLRATCVALIAWAGCTALVARVSLAFDLPLISMHDLLFLPSLAAVVLVLPLATVFEAKLRSEGWAVAWRAAVVKPLLALRPRGLGEWTGALCVLCAAWLLPRLSFLDWEASWRDPAHSGLGALLFTVCAASAPIVLSFVAVRALRRGAFRVRAVCLITLVVGWCLVLMMAGQQAQTFVQRMADLTNEMRGYMERADPCDMETLPGETVDEKIESSRDIALMRFSWTGEPQQHLTAPNVREDLVLSPEEASTVQILPELAENARRLAARVRGFAGTVVLLVAIAAGLAILPSGPRER